MRGRRFGRPAAKKSSPKGKRESSESTVFYEESVPVDPVAIRTATLNSLKHLGEQRFALPPFSEHFQRWIKDIREVVAEFELGLPSALDEAGKLLVENTVANVEGSLNQLAASETKMSGEAAEVQRELAGRENELSQLEHAYRAKTSQLRRRSEQSFEKMQSEIIALDRQRSKLLHAKPTLLQRLLRKPETKLEEKTGALQSRKKNLVGRKEWLRQELEKHRIEYERNRAELVQKIDTLRTKVKETKGHALDDAVEIRRKTCDELSKIVQNGVGKLLSQSDLPAIDTTEEPA